MTRVCDHSQVNRNLILAALLIDDKDSHEYFGHKYNISNNIKSYLNTSAKNLKLISDNKNFFDKDLEKNIYFYDKNYLINLNILNFVLNTKQKQKIFPIY